MGIVAKVRSFLKKFKLVGKGDKIVIGVSGGPDSVALLLILHKLAFEFNLKLYVAHFNHCMRAKAQQDALFVQRLADKLKLPFYYGQDDSKDILKNSSLEEYARKKRFNFLFKTCKKLGAKKIALGHNFDDQAETVLMRILRGTGLYGLGGILPKRKIDGFIVIRPLLQIKRKEIENFLQRKKIKPCFDATNREEIFLRNRVRLKLLPFLEKNFNKNIKEVLFSLAESASCDYDYLIGQARRIYSSRKKLKVESLKKMHPAMRRLIIRLKIFEVQKDMRRITFKHMQEIEDLIFNRPNRSKVDLPKGIAVVKLNDILEFSRSKLSSN